MLLVNIYITRSSLSPASDESDQESGNEETDDRQSWYVMCYFLI